MRIIVSRIFVLSLIGLLLVTGSHWVAHEWVLHGFFLLAVLLIGIAAMGRIWCSCYIAGRKNAQLVTDGPYSMCRNPLYFFSLVGALGAGFVTGTLTLPALIGLGFLAKYPGTIRGEGAYLAKRYGDTYARYAQDVPCFVPRWGLLKEPEHYDVNPVRFRKDLGSVVWFIFALGLMPVLLGGIRLAQGRGWLPLLWNLY